MTLRLRLFLFYYNRMQKNPDYAKALPHKVRAYNEAQLAKVANLLDDKPIPLDLVEDQEIPVRDGSQIPIRIYSPSEATDLPIIIFYHGGGFVTRSIDSHDRACRRLAHINTARVVSVGYRLAPEYKFPIPVEDSYDALLWVAQNLTTSAGIHLAGDSAGANLATVASILARDMAGPKIASQILIYPVTDARMQHPSVEKYANGYLLSKDLMAWFIEHYQRDASDLTNPLMSPLLAEDLTQLPPAFVCIAGLDPLRDEGQEYAEKLSAAGNATVFKLYPEVIHGFLNMPKVIPQANRDLHEDIRLFLLGLD